MAAPGIPQTATGVVKVAERGGLEGLRATLGCSRRQAEQVLSLARRALQTGGVLGPDDIPVNTVPKAQARQMPTPEPAQLDPEDEAQARARAIRALQPSERTRTVAELQGKAESMRRNIRAGYGEWRHELGIVERVLDPVGKVVTASQTRNQARNGSWSVCACVAVFMADRGCARCRGSAAWSSSATRRANWGDA